MATASKGCLIEPLESRMMMSTVVLGPPDVVVTVPAAFSKSYISGGPTKGLKIPVNLANDGTGPASGNVDVVLFASLTQVVDLNAAQLTPKPVVLSGGIAAGHNRTYEIPVNSFPQNLSGNYYITANVNGKSVNASGVSSNTVTVQPAYVDFAVNVAKVPGSGRLNQSISITLDIQNLGNTDAKGSLLVIDLGETANSDGSGSTQLPTAEQKHILIHPGKTLVVHINEKLPIGTASGNQYIVATVDPGNTFNDPTLTNNTNTSLSPVSIT